LTEDSTQVDAHECATELIPWYVNGTLESAERAQLEAHLQSCEACRREHQAQVRLHEAMQTDDTLVFAAEPSFRKLMTRIGTQEDAGDLGRAAAPAATAPQSAPAPRWPGRAVRWLAAATVIEALGLGYGVWAWHTDQAVPSSYITLTTPAASYRDTPRIRIVFRPGLSVQELGTLLHRAGAHIVDGPTDSNVYTLGFTGQEVTAQDLERRAADLRASSEVLFAEPLGTANEAR